MARRKTKLLPAASCAASLTGLAAVVAMWMLAGCQLPAAILSKMFPKEKIPPKFTLPAGKKVLVFPCDMLNPLSYPPVKRTLARRANELLVEHKLVAGTVAYDGLVDLRNADVDFNRLAVSTIGRRLGADLVVYVCIEEFRLKDTSTDMLWRGRFSVKVRVVDVHKGRLWPDESAGFPVRVVEAVTENASEAYGAELADKLAERMAEKVCGLFHKHYVDRARPKEKKTEPDSAFGD